MYTHTPPPPCLKANNDLVVSALKGTVVMDAETCGGRTDLCLLSVAVQAMLDTFE
jgi:hypothetical protein